jgi:signal transduction histidine kinase
VSARSLSSRVTRGMALVAVLSATLLALASSLTARLLWQAQEEHELAAASDALVAAIEREARESRSSDGQAVPEAFRESTLFGQRAEVWRGQRLLAASAAGAPVGPLEEGPGAGAWVRRTRSLGDGLTLVVAAPSEHGDRALRVFAFSLLLASPACLGIALLVGRVVAGRETRPLLDLQARIQSLSGLEPLAPSGMSDIPNEVQSLESAFRALWTRLLDLLRREREFAANASHELRMPLTRIRLNAERALAEAGPQAREALTAQLAEVDRLARLVDSLLILSREASSGIPRGETVNLADVCRRVTARVLDGTRPADCRFPDEALVRGDEDLIEIAVQNLVDNARKFAADEGPVRAELTDAQGRLRLEVTTPGARIAGLDRDRLFDRFHRGPEARTRAEGHGLGLALARHVARLHGGDLRCVSGETDDARFALELPGWSEERRPAPEGRS